MLREGLRFLDIAGPHRCLLVTSADAGEGKTTVAVNLCPGPDRGRGARDPDRRGPTPSGGGSSARPGGSAAGPIQRRSSPPSRFPRCSSTSRPGGAAAPPADRPHAAQPRRPAAHPAHAAVARRDPRAGRRGDRRRGAAAAGLRHQGAARPAERRRRADGRARLFHAPRPCLRRPSRARTDRAPGARPGAHRGAASRPATTATTETTATTAAGAEHVRRRWSPSRATDPNLGSGVRPSRAPQRVERRLPGSVGPEHAEPALLVAGVPAEVPVGVVEQAVHVPV